MPDLHVTADGSQEVRDALRAAGRIPLSPQPAVEVFGSDAVASAYLDVLETLDTLTQELGEEADELSEAMSTTSSTLAERDARLAREGAR